MKTFPQPKRNRSHAKRKNHYQKRQTAHKPAKQSRKHGGSDDYHTA
ncbi:hypothetical protein ACTXNE_01670 [Psychrobacter namhaensis]